MTNDLNNIPAVVRHFLRLIATDGEGQYRWSETKNIKTANDALPLIEKLCQPNIVIVDLDDATQIKKMVDRMQIEDAEIFPTLGLKQEKYCERIIKAALAALKGKP